MDYKKIDNKAGLNGEGSFTGGPQGSQNAAPQENIPQPLNVEEDVANLAKIIKGITSRHEIYKNPFWKLVGQDLTVRQHSFILFPSFSPILAKYFFVMDQQVGTRVLKYVYGREGTEFERFWIELLKECEQYIKFDEKTHKISLLFYDPTNNVSIPQRSKVLIYYEKLGLMKNDASINNWKKEFVESKQLICEYEASSNGPAVFVFATAQSATQAEKKLQPYFPSLTLRNYCQTEEENIYVTLDELARKSHMFR